MFLSVDFLPLLLILMDDIDATDVEVGRDLKNLHVGFVTEIYSIGVEHELNII